MKWIRCASALLAGFLSIGALLAQPINSLETTEKFEALLYHVERSYVDSVDGSKLVEDAIKGMLDQLDPHSVYIPRSELEKMNEPLLGKFEGIGIQFNILRDTIHVVSPISGGPSEKLGIRASDKIVTIEDENVAGIGIKNSDVTEKLRGDKGSKVKVGIFRHGEKELLDYVITRDQIPIFSVDATYMVDDEIGYIKVNRFSANTMKEFKESMASLRDQGMKHLILDLQGNGGGYLKTAMQMADEFLKDDQLIVYTEGRSVPKDEMFATQAGNFEEGKLAVLIDEGSASASEIVTGAIQDWDRGLVFGRRSFGKGLVQRPIMLPDGSAIRLTISRYYTPSGRCIQKSYDEGKEAYQKEKYERYLNGELTSLDSIQLPDSLKFFTNNKRIVYGGGGILPDIFVPLDTTGNSDYYRDIVRKGIMNSYVLTYTTQKREALLSKYPDVNAFDANFSIDDAILSDFFEYAEKEGVKKDQEGYEKAKRYFNSHLKALIARNLWDSSAFFQVINKVNPVFEKAVSALEDDTYKKMNLAATGF